MAEVLLSTASKRRFAEVQDTVAALQPTAQAEGSVALSDRRQPTLLRRLDVVSGGLGHADQTRHRLVILNGPAARTLSRGDAIVIKARLAPAGAIAVHAPWTLLGRLASGLRRRATDAAPYRPLRGISRTEAALIEAGLYVRTVWVGATWTKDRWLIASTAPIKDDRFRDSIGRVAADYLNVATLVGASTAL